MLCNGGDRIVLTWHLQVIGFQSSASAHFVYGSSHQLMVLHGSVLAWPLREE